MYSFQHLFHPLDLGSEGSETLVDTLVAAVYLLDIVNPAAAFGRKGCNKERDTRTDVGRRHADPAQPVLAV
jgi:hypothetical protein